MAETATTAIRNVLSSDIHITGTVKFANELILDGEVNGEIISEGIVTIGKKAEVTGDINTGSAIVYGTVHGNITVTDRAELKGSCEVVGDLKAARVVIEEGAVFVGTSQMTGRPKKDLSAQRPVAGVAATPRV